MKTSQLNESVLTKTIYLGRHDQHVLEVNFIINSEPPDESVGYMTWHHEIDGVRVAVFNGIKRIPNNNDYFRWLDQVVEPSLTNTIPEFLEEEGQY